jgi:type II secretory pathway pseudopilin PulG
MMKSEKGVMLIEVVVAMALLGIIGVALLSGTATTSSARITADERSASKILAESTIEQIKNLDYASSYDIEVPPEFTGYTIDVVVQNLMTNNLQSITAAIHHRGKTVLTLETYKSNR